MKLSASTREKIVEALGRGDTYVTIMDALGVSMFHVGEIQRQEVEAGRLPPRRRGGRKGFKRKTSDWHFEAANLHEKNPAVWSVLRLARHYRVSRQAVEQALASVERNREIENDQRRAG